jgi:chromosome segregation ATPase
MLDRFEEQSTADQKGWDQYDAWSDQQQADKKAVLQEQESLVSVNSASQHSSEAILQSLGEALSLLKQEAKETKSSIAELESMRAEEHKEFERTVADLDATLDSIDKALEILQGHYGASSLSQLRPALSRALQLVTLHGPVAETQVSLLTRALQEPKYLTAEYMDKDYSASSNQPGGTGVLAALKALRDQMANSRSTEVTKETGARREFEGAKDAKDMDLERAMSEIALKEDQAAEAKATAELAKAVVTQAELDIKEAQGALDILVQDYAHFRDVYTERVRTRTKEVFSTRQALESLRAVSGGAISLVQARKNHRRTLLQVDDSSVPLKQAHALRKIAESDRSAALLEASVAVRRLDNAAARKAGGGFAPEALNPVTDLLRQLIARLQEEASAETSHNEWCANEKATATEAKTGRTATIASLEQEIPRLETSIQMTTREIEFAKETLTRIADENVAASAVRSTASDEFNRARGDHEEVIRALDSALNTLNGLRFSLAQTGTTTTRKTKQSPFASVSEAPAAASAVQMLQDLRNQYFAAKTDLENEEADQQSAYQQTLQANEVFRRATQQNLHTKEAELRQFKQRKQEAINELDGAKVELGQVTQYLADLRPSCDDIRSTFEERQRRRETEIQALQAALSALEGSMVSS